MKNRLEILAEIDKLEDNHCATCKLVDSTDSNQYCITKCDVGKRLTALGDQLLGPKQEKIKKILAKGRDMTTGEIAYLLEIGVTKGKIAAELKMDKNISSKLFRDIERVEKMKTNREIVKDLRKKGLSPKEIAEKTKIPINTIYTYTTSAQKPKGVNEIKKEYEKLKKKYDSLENENKNLVKQIKKLADDNVELDKEKRGLESSYKKLDSEFFELQDKYLKNKSVDEELTKLEKENSDLRLLVAVKEDEIKELDKQLETETIKHETLFRYVTLARGVH